MKRELITEEEIYDEIRKYRIENVADVRAVFMELNGELTVIKKSNDGAVNTSLEDLPKQIR